MGRGERDTRRPLILCEYNHAMGQAGGLADYWAMFGRRGLQGGFVWEWCDHGCAGRRRRRPCWRTAATSASRSTTATSCATVLRVARSRVPTRCWPSWRRWRSRSMSALDERAPRVANRRWFTALDDVRAAWNSRRRRAGGRGRAGAPAVGPRAVPVVGLPGRRGRRRRSPPHARASVGWATAWGSQVERAATAASTPAAWTGHACPVGPERTACVDDGDPSRSTPSPSAGPTCRCGRRPTTTAPGSAGTADVGAGATWVGSASTGCRRAAPRPRCGVIRTASTGVECLGTAVRRSPTAAWRWTTAVRITEQVDDCPPSTTTSPRVGVTFELRPGSTPSSGSDSAPTRRTPTRCRPPGRTVALDGDRPTRRLRVPPAPRLPPRHGLGRDALTPTGVRVDADRRVGFARAAPLGRRSHRGPAHHRPPRPRRDVRAPRRRPPRPRHGVLWAGHPSPPPGAGRHLPLRLDPHRPVFWAASRSGVRD